MIISGFKIKSAGLFALAFREHEAQLVINISWKAMIARFCGGKQKKHLNAYIQRESFFSKKVI